MEGDTRVRRRTLEECTIIEEKVHQMGAQRQPLSIHLGMM